MEKNKEFGKNENRIGGGENVFCFLDHNTDAPACILHRNSLHNILSL